MMWNPSWVKDASFTNDECPFSSFSVFPDLSSWILETRVLDNLASQIKEQLGLIKNHFYSTHEQIKRVAELQMLFLAPVDGLGAD